MRYIVINSILNVIHGIRKIRKISNSQYFDEFQDIYIFKEQFLYQDRKINETRWHPLRSFNPISLKMFHVQLSPSNFMTSL